MTSIVLIGYRGSGKTTIGKLLAERLSWTFVDSDEWIVQRAGKTIKEIFESQGEQAFRDLETAVISEVARLSDHVIAVGGGATNRPQNRELLRAGGAKVVYLKCAVAELHRRITADKNSAANRPALTKLGGSLAEIESLLAEREPIYRSIETWEIDVTGLTPLQASEQIARRVREMV